MYVLNLFYTFANGKTGVSIFFVLSGFLITYLIITEIHLRGKIDVLKFYARRSLRIWPLYFFILLIIFVLIPMLSGLLHIDWKKFDMNPGYYFAYLGNFDVLRIYKTGGLDFAPSTVTWSVAIEEQFYVVWPLLFYITSPKVYKYIFPFVLLCSYIFRMYHQADENILYFHTLSVCGDLALGGYAAYLSINNKKFIAFFKHQSFITRAAFYVLGLIGLYFLQLLNTTYWQAGGRLLQTLFFAYIILDQNFATSDRLKFSNWKFISRIGKYTYGLYLYHTLVIMFVLTIASKIMHIDILNARNLYLAGIVSFPLSILVSYISYKYFESIFLKIKLRYTHITK